MHRPARVKLVEVGPRDGLQNEPKPIATAVKLALIDRLALAGLPVVEAGSFVSPKWVPQMADSAEIYRAMVRRPGVAYPALVPNMKGLEAALAVGVDEIAVFVAASEGFSQRNIACSRDESLDRVLPVIAAARDAGLKIRGYVSCVIACPYDGAIAPDAVLRMSAPLIEAGCYEVSLGDTIGVGTGDCVRRLIAHVAARIPRERVALHCHDTYGQGVANILAGLDEGVTIFDSSVAGLGGCPFAVGATGNVATEDVLFLMAGLGIATGIDAVAVAETGAWISAELGRPNNARAGRALLSKAGRSTGISTGVSTGISTGG